MLKRALIAAFVLSFLSSLAQAYYIKSFHSEIHLLDDGSYTVAEKIVVDFGGEQRHGIYRDIIYKYRLPIGIKRVRLAVRGVTDEMGDSYEYKLTKRGEALNIRIGSPDFTISGVKTYIIHYRVENAMLYFDDHDELYWNATGTGWECDIREATATVYPPPGMPSSELRTRCYSGQYGSTSMNCGSEIFPNEVRFFSTKPLGPLEGISIVLSMPKGYISKPSFLDWLGWYLADLWPLLFLPIGLIWLGLAYLRRGKDPLQLSIAPRYDVPDNITPAEAGTIVDERVDTRDMTSTIVDLAVRGYIKIIELETKKLLFLKNTDYALVKLKPPDSALKTHETLLLKGIFKKGTISSEALTQTIEREPKANGAEIVTISSLKDKFYIELPAIRDAIYDSIVEMGYFSSRPDKVRAKFLALGIIIFVIAFPLAISTGKVAFGASLVPLGIVTAIAGFFMPSKTKKGCIAASHIAGFEEFVHRVEKDRIERMATEDPTVFERLLPFAMALGVADQWAEAFMDIFKNQPDWYVGHSGGSFQSQLFVHNIGRAVDTCGSAMSSRPRSSGAGGGHSGFGGGGFSGGGFGGGGGGAW